MTAWIPDVVPDQTIESAWGNTIRDRTVTPFANVAARTTAIPTPKAGMVTWLDDVKRLEVYNGTVWRPMSNKTNPTAVIGSSPTGPLYAFEENLASSIGTAFGACNLAIPAGTFSTGIVSVQLSPRFDAVAGGPATVQCVYANSNLNALHVIALQANGGYVGQGWGIQVSVRAVGA